MWDVRICGVMLFLFVFVNELQAKPRELDLSQAVVVVSPGERGQAEKMAATILVEEVAKRTGIPLEVRDNLPGDGHAVIVIANLENDLSQDKKLKLWEPKPEGYLIRTRAGNDVGDARVDVVGADSRGAMYGVGRLLRELRCGKGEIKLGATFHVASVPEYRARGHELGYRARANSYDAWSKEQYEQYIREQVIFGMNCVQGIPIQDERTNSMMTYSREEMNRTIGEICAEYDVDYWVWTPVEFSLTDNKLWQAELKKHEAFYKSTPRLDAVFVPGGDPGENPPELVLPFMEDLAKLLEKTHPAAKVWVSLQDFDEAKVQYVMEYISREQPQWFGGIVADTSALPLGETRQRLPKNYPVRWYPDITHTVECQFPVSWWDPAYAVTLGREPTNPRPAAYTSIFRRFGPFTDGFVTYSDGMHDDVNKAMWSMLGWESGQDVREMLVQYARFYFGAEAANEAADGLLGLENNWRGSLAENAGVDGVLALWQRLEKRHPELLGNWRFQQHLMRAYYDAYTRHRLIYETKLWRKAMKVLARAKKIGAEAAMQGAEKVLGQAVTRPTRPKLRFRTDELAVALFESIGYQTSVERFGASGAERGCVMDFLDRPLNDRWWLEEEFKKIRLLATETEKLSRLDVIRTWEEPGEGSFYDDIAHVGKSPRVIRGEETNTDPEGRRHENPGHSWVEDGKSHRKLAWLHHMRWPVGLMYDGLESGTRYEVRLTGQGVSPLRGDGVRLEVTKRAEKIGEFQEFAVPAELTADGSLRLTWDSVDEEHLHWSEHSHVAEVWLLKR